MGYPHFTGDSENWGDGGRHCIRWQGAPPEVVTLCGSTRFPEAFAAETRRLTLEGKIVISVGLFGHQEPDFDWERLKGRLDELHLRKIDLADRVHVVNVGGYVGESTAREITYATQHSIPVSYMETAARANKALS